MRAGSVCQWPFCIFRRVKILLSFFFFLPFCNSLGFASSLLLRSISIIKAVLLLRIFKNKFKTLSNFEVPGMRGRGAQARYRGDGHFQQGHPEETTKTEFHSPYLGIWTFAACVTCLRGRKPTTANEMSFLFHTYLWWTNWIKAGNI